MLVERILTKKAEKTGGHGRWVLSGGHEQFFVPLGVGVAAICGVRVSYLGDVDRTCLGCARSPRGEHSGCNPSYERLRFGNRFFDCFTLPNRTFRVHKPLFGGG
jgi:hypothetical protein